MYTIEHLYDLTHTAAADYLRQFQEPWLALPGIRNMIEHLGPALDPQEYLCPEPGVWIHKTAKVAPTASITGPCIIGADTQVRHCAFIRGSALIGSGCVVGNSVELKNVILFDCAKVPHFSYVGDSILGYRAHMGAGSIISNLRSDGGNIIIQTQPPVYTGCRKIGAMLGDFVEIGCNAVINPGTIIGRRCQIYPTCSVRGVIPPDSLYVSGGVIIPKKEL